MSKPILCMDFDGVIHSYTSGWTGGADHIPDPPVEGAFHFLKLATEYFEVHVFSSRSHQAGGRLAMKEWFEKHKRAGDSEWIGKLVFALVKPAAKVSIDDRAIQFTGVWPSMDELINFQPWNKR